MAARTEQYWLVWRVLRKESICLMRQRSWCVSTDPQFAAKAADVVGLYLNPSQNALMLLVDEKPSIQALERATGYVQTDNGKIVRGFKSTYKRHGTLNLFAALEVATGAVRTRITHKKRRIEFLEFMDQVLSDLPAAKEIHVILDNYRIHAETEPTIGACTWSHNAKVIQPRCDLLVRPPLRVQRATQRRPWFLLQVSRG